jgi:hypothetical protein
MLALQACSKSQPVTAVDIPGHYSLSFARSTDSLELRENGTYHHQVWDGANLAFAESGNWTFTTKDGDPAVEFSKFSAGVSDLPAPHRPEPGWWIAPMRRDRAGKVTILVTRDIGLHYTHL